MSMEDILKILVDSRQQPASGSSADPMRELIGSLLGGGSAQGTGSHAPQAPQGWTPQGSGQPAGLGDMMSLLEMVMGNQGGQSSASSSPIMALLQPFVPKLAKKMNISPEIATIIISFVVHKLLSHHPTSNRDSNSFDLDSMLSQMGSGNIDPGLLQSSGMISELSRKTGLDEATTAQSLNTALTMFGKQIQPAGRPSSKPSSSMSKAKSATRIPGSAGTKRGSKLQRPK